MARSDRGTLVTTFRYPIRVEVRRPKFERSASLAYIDVAKLARAARAEFELGHFEAGGCRKAVVGIVRRGMVTALRVEPCAQCKPVRLTPELQAVLKVAQRRIGRRRDGPFRPMSVARFMSRVAELVSDCYIICIGRLCVYCCEIGPRWDCWIYISPDLEARLLQ
jgi:hypothetical protein